MTARVSIADLVSPDGKRASDRSSNRAIQMGHLFFELIDEGTLLSCAFAALLTRLPLR